MSAKNLLIIMSDEHACEFAGCYGHPLVKTPNIDAIAARGARFTNAYTPSPICVPTRAAFHTGRYPHETGYWDSAQPYDGRVANWGHRLQAANRRSVSIGKLHFRSSDDDNGFDPEILPMHVVDGVGWAEGLLRDPLPDYRELAGELARDVGRGESDYTAYDRAITERTCAWLQDEADTDERPWTLFVSLVAPHFPLTAPDEFYDMYASAEIDPPRHPEGHMDHRTIRELRKFWCYDDHFDDARRREGRAAYYGLVSFLDHNIGRIMRALSDSGRENETLVIYTSDHGEMLGNHGFWCKSVMYEESAGVPLVMAGPGMGAGSVVDAPVSLLDLFPTVRDVAGLEPAPGDPRHGRSLLATLDAPDSGRTVLSEYHDGGSPTGFYMVRWDRWKFVYYVADRPQLFDLSGDRHELVDLGECPDHQPVRDEGERRLRAILDPEAVSARAFADQGRKLDDFGGPDGVKKLFRFNHTPTPVG